MRLSQEGLNAAFALATVQEPTSLYEMVLAPDVEVLERVRVAVGSRALVAAEALFEPYRLAFNVAPRCTGSEASSRHKKELRSLQLRRKQKLGKRRLPV